MAAQRIYDHCFPSPQSETVIEFVALPDTPRRFATFCPRIPEVSA